ncbi:MAG: tyrosine-type recombinase/integrase [Deltaproteobacteria bacterium]|nr:tyrosine-type recombinase/integrase [Deltaproteobacteria bacterium]
MPRKTRYAIPRSRVLARDTIRCYPQAPKRFRLQRQKRDGQPYWTLISGSGSRRQSLSLGVVTEGEAARYLAAMEFVRIFYMFCEEEAANIVGCTFEARPFPSVLNLVPPVLNERNKLQWEQIHPYWLLEYVRRAADREVARTEVLRFLWLVGEKEGLVEAVTGAPIVENIKAIAEVVGGTESPRIQRMMPLRQYVLRVWEPVRKERNPRTWSREEGLWRRNLLPALGDLRMVELNGPAFDKFIREVTCQDGRPLSGASRRLIREAYRACVEHAERTGVIEQVHKFYRLPGTTARVLEEARPLSEEEIDVLIAAATSATYRALFALAFEVGPRPSEVGRTRWEDVTWPAPSEKGWGRILLRGTKTEKARDVVPLGPRSGPLLRALWECSGHPASGPIFLWHGKPIHSYGRALRLAAHKAGIDKDRRIFPYLGRHTAGTAAVKNTGDPRAAATLLRHTSPAMVEKTYDHGSAADRLHAPTLYGVRVPEGEA